jgi:hypothetical protein
MDDLDKEDIESWLKLSESSLYKLWDNDADNAIYGKLPPRPGVLMLELEKVGDLYIVSDNVFLVYGQGETIHIAMADYATSLLEYYEILQKHGKANDANAKESLAKLLGMV